MMVLGRHTAMMVLGSHADHVDADDAHYGDLEFLVCN